MVRSLIIFSLTNQGSRAPGGHNPCASKKLKKPKKVLDKPLAPCYNIIMSYNATTVPCAIEERHELSLTLGKAFAQSYAIHPMCEQTQELLEMYREARRNVDNEHPQDERYGSYDAYMATQGFGS